MASRDAPIAEQEQADLFEECLAPPRSALPPAKLPTNLTTRSHAVHRWYNFIAGFSPEYVEQCCASALSGKERPTLLDPFSGCGTALVEGVRLGCDCVGFESQPYLARVSRAKIRPWSSVDVDAVEEALKGRGDRSSVESELSPSATAYLAKLFTKESLGQLLRMRAEAQALPADLSDLGFLALSRALELSCGAQTDGIYKAPTSVKAASPPTESIARVIAMMREDVQARSRRSVGAEATLYDQPSWDMSPVSDDSVDIVVTSPPYLNNFDFAEMKRMHLYFWGIAADWSDITEKVRSKLIVNTTTALRGHKERQDEYRQSLPSVLLRVVDPIVASLREQRSLRAGKKEYDLLVYPYFAQMKRVLSEVLRTMKRGAALRLIVADAALYGVHIPTERLLADLASELGFGGVEIARLRDRGRRWIMAKRQGSEQGLGEFELRAVKRA